MSEHCGDGGDWKDGRTCLPQQAASHLALEQHAWVVAVAENDEALALVGALEAQHIEAAQSVIRSLYTVTQ